MNSLEQIVEHHLGPPGRLIWRSKSGFRAEFPRHLAVFNAQIHIGGETVWRGDIDLTVDEPVLKAIAQQVGELYVLTEHRRCSRQATRG